MELSSDQMNVRCLLIEALVKSMVLKGITDNAKLIQAVDDMFRPETIDEMERYSESIIFAKLGTLN
jgi:hypothetical protein